MSKNLAFKLCLYEQWAVLNAVQAFSYLFFSENYRSLGWSGETSTYILNTASSTQHTHESGYFPFQLCYSLRKPDFGDPCKSVWQILDLTNQCLEFVLPPIPAYVIAR
jgi:hypothetical protein